MSNLREHIMNIETNAEAMTSEKDHEIIKEHMIEILEEVNKIREIIDDIEMKSNEIQRLSSIISKDTY